MKSAEEIAVFLKMKDRPSSEAELLRFAAGCDRLPFVQSELFRIHFELYHRLYRILEICGPEGWYLHTDPMRIRLVRIPKGCCYYFPSSGIFCAEGNASRCAEHPHRENPALPQFDPLREFYLNIENISYWNDPLFQKSLRGTAVYCFRTGAVRGALAFFGIGLKNPGRAIIVRRYRELAREYHPDLHRGDDSLMKELNAHYDVLREAVPF